MFILPRWVPSWRICFVILMPLLLSPLAFTGVEGRCAYVILLMAFYWMTEVVPIPVTALIPVFAFPLLGVLSTGELCLVYMKETNMMFLGGLTVAIAVEYCNLHRRIALFVILTVGQSPRKLMVGFMITTMFLSMWISNTASTAMMVPIVDAILQELYKTRSNTPVSRKDDDGSRLSSGSGSHPISGGEPNNTIDSTGSVAMTQFGKHEKSSSSNNFNSKTYEDSECHQIADNNETVMFAPPPNEECCRLRDMIYLSTAYAANLGGTGSLTGTGPNLVFKGVMDKSFGEAHGLNFGTWMAYNVPGMILCGLLGFLWLQVLFTACRKDNIFQSDPEKDRVITKLLKKKYRQLGRMNFHETVVLTLFCSLVLLWLFRSPGFVTGWADLLREIIPDTKIADATPAMLIVFLLFVIPRKTKYFWNRNDEENEADGAKKGKACLSWEVVHQKIPWGIVLLLGGGFAMAEAADKSKMSLLLGQQLGSLYVLPKEAIVFLVSIMTAGITEAASNTATASILLPVLKELSLGIHVNPIYLMLPHTLCCSYAFMLPVATPPNAIVFGASGMRTITMIKAGFVMNLICVGVSMLMISTLGVAMFDLNNFPDWANSTITPT